MKKIIHLVVIVALLCTTYVMYNEQLGAIPILLLAIYLFYVVYSRMKVNDKSK
ncbi:hypothetical protein [Kurthia sibirica]|uniref:hypothetical protein n=1 Tax=Kurthia sibirica TaxID=202750 RepID=UPI001169949C|nr:hypothetical protein [Kurthia sibirica]GEK33238.1 hypothetical protein KSI01_07710 [Kurthia sibirica]